MKMQIMNCKQVQCPFEMKMFTFSKLKVNNIERVPRNGLKTIFQTQGRWPAVLNAAAKVKSIGIPMTIVIQMWFLFTTTAYKF